MIKNTGKLAPHIDRYSGFVFDRNISTITKKMIVELMNLKGFEVKDMTLAMGYKKTQTIGDFKSGRREVPPARWVMALQAKAKPNTAKALRLFGADIIPMLHNTIPERRLLMINTRANIGYNMVDFGALMQLTVEPQCFTSCISDCENGSRRISAEENARVATIFLLHKAGKLKA